MPEQDKYAPLSKLFDFSSQGAVVTGGALGVGFGIARRLAGVGVGILIADINAEAVKKNGRKAGFSGVQSSQGAM